jgi:hypothetical protein
MRISRELETKEHRNERLERQAQQRIERAFAEDKDLDAAVRQSIKLYGP